MTEPDSSTTVGFVGLGRMGSAMASHILASGHPTIGWDRRPEAIRAFVDIGGTAAGGLAEVGTAPVVITMVFSDADVHEVTLEPGGLIDILPKDATHVVASSISPALSRELHEAHTTRGHHYVAAPVFGRVEAAVARQLLVVCSGSRDGFERVEPILRAVGSSRLVGPEPEQAMLFKTMGNCMIFTAVETLREMFAFLRANDIDERAAKEVLVDTLFAGQIFQGYAQMYLERPEALRISDVGRKDRKNCLDVAGEKGIDLPLIHLLEQCDLP